MEEAFKRPQDLKKHHKIHCESHREQLISMKHHRIVKRLLGPLTYHPYLPTSNLFRAERNNYPYPSCHPKISNAPPVNHLEPPSNLTYIKHYEIPYQPDTIRAYIPNSMNMLEAWRDKRTNERLPSISSIIDSTFLSPSKEFSLRN
ncbi:4911_t:CDS:2 [Racocetra fulgida]|uniref:4911_t:CDS:1 n=1 Tax=Racocetra fulgida TaxID=60492 RepID=A0A9N8WDH7_9GLOM|nr:4911_t:CDS:2 [Racocetra fulgida]